MSRSALFVVTLLASLAVVPTVYCARLLVVPLSSESHIAAFAALTAPLEILGGHEIHMVVCQELADFAARGWVKLEPRAVLVTDIERVTKRGR